MKISENTKERLFEVLLVVVGFVGLLILFTALFAGPRFIYHQIYTYLK